MEILVLSKITQTEKDTLLQAFPKENFTFIRPKKATQADLDKADIIIGNPKLNMHLYSEKLKLLQLKSAGSDAYIKEGVLHPNTLLANASGSYGKAIAEHTIGMMLALNKNFPFYINNMRDQVWKSVDTGKELYHSTIAIVGLGDLGCELAKRLKAFDTHIIGLKRSLSTKPEYVDELYTIDTLDVVLPKADFVILCLPHTKDTIHIMNEARLSLMKSDAMLINVGRGSAIDTNALIKVLTNNHLYGVALDVTEEEPLPKESPLWNFDNVFITPHVSGGFVWDSVREYFMELTIRNLHHFFNQEEIENSVDFTTGYRKVNNAIK